MRTSLRAQLAMLIANQFATAKPGPQPDAKKKRKPKITKTAAAVPGHDRVKVTHGVRRFIRGRPFKGGKLVKKIRFKYISRAR